MTDSIEINIDIEGNVQFLYDDVIAQALKSLGKRSDKRASHVEPDPDNPEMWYADMSPIALKAVKLGPFETRREALISEQNWIRKFYLNVQGEVSN